MQTYTRDPILIANRRSTFADSRYFSSVTSYFYLVTVYIIFFFITQF